jgi:secondary thiamine-phosphate synthase enzyme
VKQAQHTLEIRTHGKGLVPITRRVADWVGRQGITTGLLTIWCRHTSASLTIQENADPAVREDIATFFEQLAPEDPSRYVHNEEGPDDMPGHLRAMLTEVQLTIPVGAGRMVLGTWQGIYLFEHRRTPHRRELVLHLIGE